MASRPHVAIEDVATDEQWEAIVTQLEALTFDQLEELATRLGLSFESTANLSNDDYINILDEAYWDDFEREFERVARGR